ncbi:hypothetical protein G9A89_013095 [Geosiphon pyriformis]|nr:hypothetical protein G9A89_013095 [Geosiphon pyriformis]
MYKKNFFLSFYNKSKLFFDYEATIGPVIAVIKKTIKVSGFENGFKVVALRKKRKEGVLAESIDNKEIAAEAFSARSWGSETGNTTKSESIDMKEECLVKETSVDYGESGAFTEEDPNQTPKGLHIKTKKMLGKPLSVIDYEKTMMTAGKLANDRGVVVNTNLKHPVNNHTNRAIVMKKILVGTSMEAVRTAVSKNEFRVLLYTFPVRINAYDLWDFVGLVGGETYVIDCNPVSYAHAHCAIVCFGSESDLVSVMAATPVIKGIGFRWSYLFLALCSVCGLPGHTSFNCVSVKIGSTLRSRKALFSAQNQSAPISCLLAFSDKTWASVVGAPSVCSSHGAGLLLGSDNVSKPLPSVVDDLEKHLVNIESGLISLVGQIGELAKRLESLMLANQGKDIVMGVGSDESTCDETAAATYIAKDSSVFPHVVKLENMLEGLAASVLSLSAYFDGLALVADTLPQLPSQ